MPAPLAAAYRFRAGQYLTLRTTLDGEELRRTYSISSGGDDADLRIAIKQVPGGRFSVWAQEGLRVGEAIDVMTPTGRFGVPAGGEGGLSLGFAAGSGITPIVSIMKSVLEGNPHGRFVLFYGNRATQEILFRGTIEDLKDRHLGRLSVFHVLSRERQDVAALNGRLDREKLAALLSGLLAGQAVDNAFLCGPDGMTADAAAALAEHGVDPARVHVERFTSALAGRPRVSPPVAPAAPAHAMATLVADGATSTVPVAEGETVLDAALRAGLDLPFACKGGMCSTCRARLTDGEVDMAANFSLEPWELRAGFVLTCQARPTTPTVAIDYDDQ